MVERTAQTEAGLSHSAAAAMGTEHGFGSEPQLTRKPRVKVLRLLPCSATRVQILVLPFTSYGALGKSFDPHLSSGDNDTGCG